MRKAKDYISRVFLNKRKDRGAYIMTKVARYDRYVTIADCNRVVTLDFARSKEGVEKISKLISELQAFKVALENQITAQGAESDED